MRNRLAIAPLLTALVVVGGPARAARPAGGPQVFALIVSNNRSTAASRPDLQYADDDGARYHAVFRSAAPEDQVALLTTFDGQSREIYGDLAARALPPRRAEVGRAVQALAAKMRAARAQGREVQFYFAYAGHGDVDRGRGYVDLEDGRIDGDFLEKQVIEVVSAAGASAIHVILDSCNSFFVLNPRKPGGRRWATPRDMALGFAQRHPRVGLLLSTSSEAEVYESSELESGIFSHELRSGLSGAADVDGDGRISYSELAGFIETANVRVRVRSLRPQLFYYGPGGDPSVSLWRTGPQGSRKLVLPAERRRLWVRGESGERILDLHKEEGGALTIDIPRPPEARVTVVELVPAADGGRPVLRERELGSGAGRVELAVLRPAGAAAPPRARGAGVSLEQFFAEPYGPRAYQRFVAARDPAPQEPIYGVSAADRARMRNYLQAMADLERDQGRGMGMAMALMGGTILAAGTVGYFSSDAAARDPSQLAWPAGMGLLLGGAGAYYLLSENYAAAALRDLDHRLGAAGDDWRSVLAGAEAQLEAMAERERRRRRVITWANAVLGTGLFTLGVATSALPEGRHEVSLAQRVGLFGLGAMGLYGAYSVATTLTPSERLLRLYREDPGLQLQVGVGAGPGGGALVVTGRF